MIRLMAPGHLRIFRAPPVTSRVASASSNRVSSERLELLDSVDMRPAHRTRFRSCTRRRSGSLS